MLKIKDNVDLKELEKYGFTKLEDDIRGHKYKWEQIKSNWRYEIYISKDNFIRVVVNSDESFRYVLFANKMQTKLYDLIKADLVEKCCDDNE